MFDIVECVSSGVVLQVLYIVVVIILDGVWFGVVRKDWVVGGNVVIIQQVVYFAGIVVQVLCKENGIFVGV